MSVLRQIHSLALLVLCALVFVLAVGLGGRAHAQDPSEITALYGRGVHAFFAGNISDAEQKLTECVEAGSTDPRVYYFRGVARLRQGRQHEAEEDFRIGAAYEARDPGLRFGIGNSLQRIQGPERVLLEQFRRDARVDRVQQRRSLNQQRYERLRSREADILHRAEPVPLEQLVEPSVEVQRSGQTRAQELATEAAPPVTSEPVEDQTTEEEPAPADTSSGSEDLFGPSEPEAEAPLAEAVEQSDPLGAETEEAEPSVGPAAEDDPFGTPDPGAGVEPSPGAEKAELPATDEVEDSSDPFGAAAEPAVEVPAVSPETPGTDDLFGGEAAAERAPADEAAVADPFGATEEAPATEGDEAGATADPFGATDEPAAEDPTTEETAEVADDLFDAEAAADESAEAAAAEADGSTEEAEPATEDPFGSESSEEDPASEQSESMTDDPFGAGASENESAEDSSESGDDDPFGGDTTEAESEESPTDEADSSAEDSTFGEDSEGSDAATEEDPFGGTDDDSSEGDATEGESTEEDETEAGEEAGDEADSGDETPADESADDDDPFGGF